MNKKMTKADILGSLEFSKNTNTEKSKSIYDFHDITVLNSISPSPLMGLETLDDLLERDNQREKDGFFKKIKVGRILSPGKKGGKDSIIIVPTTTEEKLVHSPFNPQSNEEESGGEGDGEKGDVVGEQPIEGTGDGEEGEGNTGNQGGGEHGISKEVYETGKVLTEQFSLPNIEDKGKKIAIPQYKYDLTDTNKKSGQVLDKMRTLYSICKTNISLGRLNRNIRNTNNFIVRPDDKIYRVLSKEKMYESQAVVFFLRDYSGSMYGLPTEAVVKQHLMLFSWLVYQYDNKVIPRFILHDTEAKEVPDFATYYRSHIAGGTMIASAYELVNHIINQENLERDYNIYIFHGTDGDDWGDRSDDTIEELKKMVNISNRTGITIARNSWGGRDEKTELEENIEKNSLQTNKSKFRLDAFKAKDADDERLITGIKYLVSEGE